MGKFAVLVEEQREFFLTDQTMAYAFRREQLTKLKKLLKDNETAFYDAVKTDLNKSDHETYTTELGFLYAEINFTLKHLQRWMTPVKADAPITHKGTASQIIPEPYGVSLVISPWNYPIQLALAPIIAAMAAGNTIILKPSEYTPKTSALLTELIEANFPRSYFTVVLGDKDTSNSLLEEHFDYIFFTGSSNVGKIVMQKASMHLTPVTLELGGKSPAIVDNNANIKLAAKRIVWGKFTNAGQTCVAPDYLYVHEDVKKDLIKAIIKQIKSLYGKNPLKNKAYTHIVSSKHFNRLQAFLINGKIIHGGNADEANRIIEPTLIDEINWEDPVMQEEIFGPLLPIMTFTSLDVVISKLKRLDKPLALYFFGNDEKQQQMITEKVSFGGGCINDTLYHLANPNLPFGGTGTSGMGSYHGKYGFDTFSHMKSVMKQTTKFDIPLRYPGSKLGSSLAKRLMK